MRRGADSCATIQILVLREGARLALATEAKRVFVEA